MNKVKVGKWKLETWSTIGQNHANFSRSKSFVCLTLVGDFKLEPIKDNERPLVLR